MFPQKYIRYGAVVILVVMGIVALIGCGHKIQPKAWLSIEKAPMRVIIVDNEKDISPATIKMIMNHVGSMQYEDYQFNSSTNVGLSHDVDFSRQDHTSSTVGVIK